MMVHREKWYGMVGVGHGISQQTYRRLTQLICFYFSCAADDGNVEKRKEDKVCCKTTGSELQWACELSVFIYEK